MFQFDADSPAGQDNCRYVAMPICEAEHTDVSQGAPIPALGVFYMRQRDTLDFGVDFTNWLVANSNGASPLTIASATWGASADSPKTPTIVGEGFDPAGRVAVIVAAPPGALAGDSYWLDLTMTTTALPASQGYPAMPGRTVVRRIKLVVVNG